MSRHHRLSTSRCTTKHVNMEHTTHSSHELAASIRSLTSDRTGASRISSTFRLTWAGLSVSGKSQNLCIETAVLYKWGVAWSRLTPISSVTMYSASYSTARLPSVLLCWGPAGIRDYGTFNLVSWSVIPLTELFGGLVAMFNCYIFCFLNKYVVKIKRSDQREIRTNRDQVTSRFFR